MPRRSGKLVATVLPIDAEPFEWQGRGPALLFVHGFTGTPWEIRPIADAMRERGWAISAIMLAGHGQSVDDLARATWSDWITEVDAAAERLIASHGRVVYVGCSLGALLALDSAVRHQDAGVAGLVSLAAALSLGAVTDRALRIALRLGDRLPDSRVVKTGGSDILDPERRAASPAYGSYPIRAARYFAHGQSRVRELAPSLRVPLLAMHGLHDTTAPVTSSLELARIAGSADSRLVVLPHSGHLIGVDRDRDEVIRQLDGFVHHIEG